MILRKRGDCAAIYLRWRRLHQAVLRVCGAVSCKITLCTYLIHVLRYGGGGGHQPHQRKFTCVFCTLKIYSVGYCMSFLYMIKLLVYRAYNFHHFLLFARNPCKEFSIFNFIAKGKLHTRRAKFILIEIFMISL